MICRNCQNEIADNSVFCPSCGTKVDNNPISQVYGEREENANPSVNASYQHANSTTKEDTILGWKKSHIAIIAIVVVAIIAIIIAVMGTSNPVVEVPSTQSAEEFYELVLETQKLLDNYADDIYGCWYDYVYEDEYSSVNSALNDAYRENIDNINVIKSNNEKIKELYQNAKEGDLNSEVKKVMQAYNDYYSFVMEVSGSFNSFSANKETLKKDLASALKNLYFELE